MVLKEICELSHPFTLIHSDSFYSSVTVSVIETVPLFFLAIISELYSQIITYYDCNRVITVCENPSCCSGLGMGGVQAFCCTFSAGRDCFLQSRSTSSSYSKPFSRVKQSPVRASPMEPDCALRPLLCSSRPGPLRFPLCVSVMDWYQHTPCLTFGGCCGLNLKSPGFGLEQQSLCYRAEVLAQASIASPSLNLQAHPVPSSSAISVLCPFQLSHVSMAS